MKKFVNSYSKNSWKHVVSSIIDLAKRNLEIDAQIEAAIKRNEDMNRAIAEAENIANQQG